MKFGQTGHVIWWLNATSQWRKVSQHAWEDTDIPVRDVSYMYRIGIPPRGGTVGHSGGQPDRFLLLRSRNNMLQRSQVNQNSCHFGEVTRHSCVNSHFTCRHLLLIKRLPRPHTTPSCALDFPMQHKPQSPYA